MDDGETPTKFDLRFAEHRICFSICDCSLDKKYSFWRLDHEEAKRFISKLRYIEKLTWKEWGSMPRESVGLTPEKPGTPNHDLIHAQSTSELKFLEQYYYHFRVEPKGLFRVFGYQCREFFCITHIDPKGKINH